MATRFLLFFIFLFSSAAHAQVTQVLTTALNNLGSDPQFKYATISFYVEDEAGKVVFEKNSKVGVSPASCQKVITSAAAFDLLGSAFRYETRFSISQTTDSAFLDIVGAGDPTLGSNRWRSTDMQSVYKTISAGLEKTKLPVALTVMPGKFSYQPIPDGWVWQDIGNYFGAGAWHFNWHENQYDLTLRSGSAEGSKTEIVSFHPAAAQLAVTNLIQAGKQGSGDNAYIYCAPFATTAFATGTIPPSREGFVISGAMPDPVQVFVRGFAAYMDKAGIPVIQKTTPATVENKSINIIYSPSFDSMNYWFMKKSINLYGEAFVKTMAAESGTIGSTENGIALIRSHWQKKGIDPDAIKILDGSGLSPSNRVTTHALVKIMQYARQQKWFASFENALPVINGIKMKDGYIGGVRSYTGYIKNTKGQLYTFSFIVNNFSGSASTVREKMWKVLNILK